MRRSHAYNIAAVLLMLPVLASCGSGSTEEDRALTKDTVSAIDPQTEQRIADLTEVNALLERYYVANGSYPKSDNAQGYASAWGASLGADWIPELATALPRDPSLSEAGDGAQYLYISNGADYKLIAHATSDCSPNIETGGVRIDPRRTDGSTCWAYGFWTAGGESF